MSKEKSLLPMLLGVAALAIALMLGGVYLFSGYLVKKMGQGTSTMRRTPERDLNVIETLDRGPMYPNAIRVDSNGDKVTIDVPVTGDFQVSSQDYITADTLEEAIAYYRKHFGKGAEESLEKGGARFKEKRDDGWSLVILKETSDKLHVRLVLILEDPK